MIVLTAVKQASQAVARPRGLADAVPITFHHGKKGEEGLHSAFEVGCKLCTLKINICGLRGIKSL